MSDFEKSRKIVEKYNIDNLLRRISELEEENKRLKREVASVCKKHESVAAYETQYAGYCWQCRIEEVEEENKRLRDALIKESEYQMGNYGSCADWITNALQTKTPLLGR